MVKKTILFFSLAFTISWSLYFIYAPSEGAFLDYVIKFGFTISGVLMLLFTKDQISFKRILSYLTDVKSLKFIWIGLLPLLVYGLSAFISVPAESLNINRSSSFSEWLYTIGFSSSSGIFFYMLFRGGFGEEVGLRAYLLPLLLDYLKPLKASLIIGVFWAIWHYPIWISQGLLIVIVLSIVVLAWSIIFTYVFLKTKNLWVVVFLHATGNCGDDIIESIFPEISAFNWELYYIGFVAIIGLVLSFYVNKLKL